MRARAVLTSVLLLFLSVTAAVSAAETTLPDWFEDGSCLETVIAMWKDDGQTPRDVFESVREEPWAPRTLGRFLDLASTECWDVPAISVDPVNDHVSGHQWPVGTVDLGYWDHETAGDPVRVARVDVSTESPEDARGWFDTSLGELGFDVGVGDIVLAGNGTFTKMLLVTPLTLDEVTAGDDAITGTASHRGVRLGLEIWSDGLHADTTAGRHATWSFDLDELRDSTGEKVPGYELEPGSQGAVREYDHDGDATQVQWNVANPRISANAAHDYVRGEEWPYPGSVDVTVTRGGTDAYTRTDVPVESWGVMPWERGFHLDLGFDLAVGDEVTTTDGTTTKELAVTALSVDAVDPALDTVSGSAEPGALIEVAVHVEEGGWRQVTADASTGAWTADFSLVPPGGSGDRVVDIVPGTQGDAREHDDDGDATEVGWGLTNPRLVATPAQGQVTGEEWPTSTDVELTLPGLTEPVTVTVEPFDHDPSLGWFQYPPEGEEGLPIAVGDRISATNGTATKELTVSALSVDPPDVAGDTVSGVAGSPDTWIDVQIWEPDAPGRALEPDGDTAFTADFSDGYDLVPGTQGAVREHDADDDATEVRWRIPNPRVMADAGHDYVRGEEWPYPGSVDVTVTRGDVDVHSVIGVPVESWGAMPWEQGFHLDIDPSLFDLATGDVVTVTDGTTTKVLLLTELAVTDVDPATETVRGTATAGSTVDVSVHAEDGGWRQVVADGAGDWLADFAADPGEAGDGTPDIEPGTRGDAREYDEDGDATEAGWWLPAPRLVANAEQDYIVGEEWPTGETVTLTVNGVPLAATVTVLPSDHDPSIGWFAFPPEGSGTPLVLGVGDTVTATDGTTTKVLTLSTLTVEDPAVGGSVISGVAGADDTPIEIQVWQEDGPGAWLEPDGTLAYSVDFGAYTFADGTQGAVREHDADGDATEVQWLASAVG